MTDDNILKAIQAIEEDNTDEAIAILEPMVLGNDPNPDALVYLGLAYIQSENVRDAIKVLRRAQELVEDHCVVALFMGRALRSLGQYDEAEEQLRRAIDLDSEDPEAWIELGKLLYSKGRYGEAARIMDEAILLFPEDLSLRGTLALALYRLGDFTQATLEWSTIHKLNPELMAATTNYAYLLMLQNRIDEALPLIEHAFKQDPADYRSLILKGMYALAKSDMQTAKDCFESILAEHPDNVEALSRLAVIEGENGNSDRCSNLLKAASSQMDSNKECWRGLCYAYSQLGWHNENIECLKNWAKLDPGAAAPWVGLAIEYDRSGKRDEALEAWRNAIDLRGYVRINCPRCRNSMKFDIDDASNFDPYQPHLCPSCKEEIEMPQGMLAL